MWFAAEMWFLMFLGYICRRNRRFHVPLVLTAIAGDLFLVIYLEFTRGAVETALKFDLKVLQQIHIGFSLAATLLYVPLLYWGFKLLKGERRVIPLHRKVAKVALTFRTLGFLFMFSMWRE